MELILFGGYQKMCMFHKPAGFGPNIFLHIFPGALKSNYQTLRKPVVRACPAPPPKSPYREPKEFITKLHVSVFSRRITKFGGFTGLKCCATSGVFL
jgi:hypothetical protein